MLLIVDGDNSPGANIKGLKRLGLGDTVYVYYASDNKYFTQKGRKERIAETAKCKVDFIKISASGNAVDFAVALDLCRIIENNSSGTIVLVSEDRHFKMIMDRAREITQCSNLFLAATIEDAITRYMLLESKSLLDLHNNLMLSYGKAGCEFYKVIENLFAGRQVKARYGFRAVVWMKKIFSRSKAKRAW